MNATASIIVMLDYSEVDIEASDIGIETIESNDYRATKIDSMAKTYGVRMPI